MTQFLLPPGFRATDANDNPLAGGYYRFYSAQTTTPKAVYSDADLSTSLGTQVDINSAGIPVSGSNTPVLIYFATGDYKAELYDSDDVLLFTFDDIPGAEAAAPTVTSAAPETPVISKTSAYTVVVGDRAKLINANPTGGSFAITLPSAVTAGDDFRIGVRHNGTANTVSVLSVLSQSIKSQKSTTSIPLVSQGETVWLVSDGADWIVDTYVPPVMKADLGVIIVQDRITAPPASPTAGARYIITGTPTGVWSSLGFAQHDIAEADGNGSWIRHTPGEGWFAFIVTGAVTTQFKSAAWSDYTNITAPATSALKIFVVADEKAQNTAGGTATAGSWTARVLNTTRVNTITGASLSSNQITLPAGDYFVNIAAPFFATTGARIRLKSTTTATSIVGSNLYLDSNVSDGGGQIYLSGYLTLSATEIFELQYIVNTTQSTNGLGNVLNIASESEVYSVVTILDMASQQGPQGTTGAQGGDGLDAAEAFQFSTSLSGDPGTGKIAVNNADLTLATQIQISETDVYGAGKGLTFASWDNSTSSVKARIKFSKEGATQNFGEYLISGAGTDQGSYWTFPVTYVNHGGTLSNADNLAVIVIEKGDKGDTGSTGSTGSTGATGATGPNVGLDYAWNTATSGDPGSGKVLVNHATPASATALHISETNRQGASQASYIATWDDSTTAADKGVLRILDVAAPGTNYLEYRITAALTDAGSYDTFPVTYIGGAGTITNATVVAVAFFRSGDKGSDGAGVGDVVGPASATDGGFAKFDLTTGKLLKNSAAVIAIADGGTGQTTAPLAFAALKQAATDIATGVVELATDGETTTGTDTTRAVTPANTAALLTAQAIKQGKHTIWMPASAMIARTTNGAAPGTAEMSTNKNMVKTLDFDATTQEFGQFEIGFPKSWNLGTVTFKPVWSHAATTVNFGVVWALEGVATSDDDALDVAFGTAQTSTDTGGTTNDRYIGPESSAITIAGTPTAGDMVQFQIKRVPSDGSDTMAIDARLHGVWLYFTLNAATDA